MPSFDDVRDGRSSSDGNNNSSSNNNHRDDTKQTRASRPITQLQQDADTYFDSPQLRRRRPHRVPTTPTKAAADSDSSTSGEDDPICDQVRESAKETVTASKELLPTPRLFVEYVRQNYREVRISARDVALVRVP